MGTDCSVLRFFSIGYNVKVCHRAGKGWTKVVPTLWPLENNYTLYIMILYGKWLSMNITINIHIYSIHVYSIGAIYSMFHIQVT